MYKALKDGIGMKPSSIVAVEEGSIPKTNIGLVERRSTKALILKERQKEQFLQKHIWIKDMVGLDGVQVHFLILVLAKAKFLSRQFKY